jgi:uncharacterized protein YbjT (DUF2867 family)
MGNNMNKILATGTTGNLGRAVVTALMAKGFTVKAAARNVLKASVPAGVEVVKFDYQDPATFDAALAGAEGAVLIAPPLDSDAPAKLNPVIDKARTTGVKHVVFISAFGVDALEQAPLRRIERYLMASGLNYTILRPNFFMENFSTGFLAPMVKQGGVYLAAGAGKTSFISVADIAEVAATAFQKGLFGKEYNLTGPEALDHSAATNILSKVTGKIITYHPLTEEAMFQGLRQNGLPESAIQYIGVLYNAVRAGYTAAVTKDVETVTGRKPLTFDAFARQNATAWA